MPRKKRLKAKNSANEDYSQNNSHDKEKNDENLDLKALAQQTYQFMISKMATSKSTQNSCSRCGEKQNLNSVEVPQFTSLRKKLNKLAKDQTKLASELQPGLDSSDLYLKFDVVGSHSSKKQTCLGNSDDKEVMKKSIITADFEKRDTAPLMHISPRALKKQRKKAREETAGPKWYNLPATKITPELKQELKLLKMRNILDKKRHYKSNDMSTLPKYFQMGTVVEGAADFYSSRVPKRERKQRLVDQLLADVEFRRYNKKKYLEIQAAKQSGRKGFYKKKINKGKRSWQKR